MGESKTFERWKLWPAVCLIVAFAAIEYGPVILSGRIPFPAAIVTGFPPYGEQYPQGPQKPVANIGDLVTYFYPYLALVSRSVGEGSFPLWNSNILSGTPLVGSTQSALFYPPNFLTYLINTKRAWALEIVLERILALLFTILLMRELGATLAGALTSALLFGFSGFLVAWQGQAMADSAVWLPLIAYSLLRLKRLGSLTAVGVAAIAFAMPILAGHPETAAHLTFSGVVIAVALLCTMSGNGPVTRMRFALGFVAAGFLALGLASVQLLPTLEWISNAHRSLESIWPPLPLRAILAFVSRDVMRFTNSAGLDIPEQAAYMSMMFFVTVPLAALKISKKLLLFFVLGCLSLFSIIYGVGPLLPLLNKVPYLGLKQWRLLLVLSLALAVLAGLGVSALEQRLTSRGFRWKAALLAAVGLLAGVAMIYGLHAHTHESVEGMRMPRASLIFLLISSAVVFARIGGWLSHLKFNVLVVFVVAFDVLTFGYGYLPFVRAHEVFPPIALFDRLKEIKGDPFRIAQLDVAYAANSEAVYGLDTAIGYEIPLERIVRFLKGAARDESDAIMVDSSALLGLKDRRVDMLNVRYFLILNSSQNAGEFFKQSDRFRFMYSAGNTDVFENLRVLPRAFLVPASGIEVISDESAQLARVADPSFDPERTVILAQSPKDPSGPEVAVSGGRSVEWMERSANSLQLKVRSSKASVLIASQIYYPGWYAAIDNVAVPVVPANYALTSVFVPPGEHEVHFYYLPSTIKVGGSASMISLIVVSVLFGLGRRRQLGDSDESAAVNPMIRSSLIWLAGAAIVIGCFWNLHATNVDLSGYPRRSQEDIVILESEYARILKELLKTDPTAKRFGYMTALTLRGVPPDPAGDLRWTQLRYLMIPRILVRDTAEPYVIGDFKKDEPLPSIPDNLVQVFDSGNGMILYKQRQAP